MIIEKYGNMISLYYPVDRTHVCAGYNIYSVRLWVEDRFLPVAILFDGVMYIDEDDIVCLKYVADNEGRVSINITLKAW